MRGTAMNDQLKALRDVQTGLELIYDLAVRSGVDNVVLSAIIRAEDVTVETRINLCNERVKSKKPTSLFESQAFSLRGAK